MEILPIEPVFHKPELVWSLAICGYFIAEIHTFFAHYFIVLPQPICLGQT